MIYKALSVLLLMTDSLHMMAAQDGTTEYTILTQSPEQHIQHFGASDAWSMQFLGLWPEKQQEQIADWLFSTENDALGKPIQPGSRKRGTGKGFADSAGHQNTVLPQCRRLLRLEQAGWPAQVSEACPAERRALFPSLLQLSPGFLYPKRTCHQHGTRRHAQPEG